MDCSPSHCRKIMDVSFSSPTNSTTSDTNMATRVYGDTIAQNSLKRKCKGCPTMVISPAAYCASCRVKNNERKRAYNAAKRQQVLKNVTESDMNAGYGGMSVNTQDGEGKKQKRNREEDGDGHDATAKKRKLHGIEKPKPKTKTTTPPYPVAPSGQMNECQSELEMVRRLKEIAICPSAFHACYSIVADPSVGHRTQAGLAARNIKKSAKWPFNYKDVIRTIAPRTSCTLRFRCECHLRLRPTAPRPLASWLNSGRKSEKELMTTVPLKTAEPIADIRAKLAKSGTNSSEALVEEPSAAMEPCTGIIEVTAEDDTSHPLGIPGQRIRVNIHHP
ncbi:hypothetical protein E1B28_004241 [Marasmius oreades]|uniref:Uncharacterized protein n=1 Tax=Marasmius oreades TaxID=181124 RepID=A0A9P7UY90_9AGAR|nr:uncharacterized protein E1B28_004241 [Marasmius oreades]KAG7096832.1 hypothetical protein E1B28_004241 [Marasmius oreades]